MDHTILNIPIFWGRVFPTFILEINCYIHINKYLNHSLGIYSEKWNYWGKGCG